jgi:hypothetical protein
VYQRAPQTNDAEKDQFAHDLHVSYMKINALFETIALRSLIIIFSPIQGQTLSPVPFSNSPNTATRHAALMRRRLAFFSPHLSSPFPFSPVSPASSRGIALPRAAGCFPRYAPDAPSWKSLPGEKPARGLGNRLEKNQALAQRPFA